MVDVMLAFKRLIKVLPDFILSIHLLPYMTTYVCYYVINLVKLYAVTFYFSIKLLFVNQIPIQYHTPDIQILINIQFNHNKDGLLEVVFSGGSI